jgi:hypothetical protein
MDEKPNVGNGADGVKPEGKPEKDQINLKVKDADGNEVQFKVLAILFFHLFLSTGRRRNTMSSVCC